MAERSVEAARAADAAAARTPASRALRRSPRLGQRPSLTSPVVPLIAHARPTMLPWILGIVVFGYAFTHWDQGLYLVAPGQLGILLAAWTSGHVGTLWLNAALDGDERGVVFARGAPVPRGVGLAGYAALAFALGLAAMLRPPVAVCVLAAVALAVLYSHPSVAWKGHALGGPLVNLLGYGWLSPLAGSLVASGVVTGRLLLTLGLWSLWLLGAYLSAQAFQEDDDRRRGYRTLVATRGPAVTLGVARWAMNLAILGALLATLGGLFPRLTLFAYPAFLAADRWMRRWQRQPGGGGPSWAVGLFRRMLLGGLGVFALAWFDYWFG